jgi:hypothetical protein
VSDNSQSQEDTEKSEEKKKGFHIPTLEISPEKEEEIVETIASRIVNNRLEAAAMLFLIPFRPISPIASQLTLLPFAPLLEAFNIPGFDYVSFLRNSDNVSNLLQRIEEKAKIRDEKNRKEKGDNWFSKLMKRFGL